MQFETTPPPADPASSPVLVLYTESLIMTGLPSAFTVVAVCAASDDLAMFGYGIGTGPPGVGVLHTSGKTGATPPESLWTIVIGLLISTVTPISSPGSLKTPAAASTGQLIRTAAPLIVCTPRAR